jgi:hypothetical protein
MVSGKTLPVFLSVTGGAMHFLYRVAIHLISGILLWLKKLSNTIPEPGNSMLLKELEKRIIENQPL